MFVCPAWNWRLPLVGVVALLLAAGDVAAASGVGYRLDGDPGAPAASVGTAVTLVTGDRVRVEQRSDQLRVVAVEPAPRPGFDGTFRTVDNGGQLYVLPSDVTPWLDRVLDRELFNVSKLAGADRLRRVPVITTYRPAGTDGAAMSGLAVTGELPSIGAAVAQVEPGGEWWRAVTAVPAGTGATGTAAAPGPPSVGAPGPPSGSGRVWLDEQVSVSPADSVPMVGAPEAWEAGWDGSGVRVAVLDTGVDSDHPGLAGKVVAQRDFSGSGGVADRLGHGTHVAGIVAGGEFGGGEAGGGRRTGVAPGVELVNGKVLGDDGTGTESAIIAGMEWAVRQGADVVNLSLGGAPSDGSDPLSLAVDELTAADDVLFVVAAGNSGPERWTIGSPGAADAALTVGSVAKDGRLAASSSRGPRPGELAVKPDLTAPGVGIVSARAAGTSMGSPVGEHYTQMSGTSMAAPHVAGAAAILRQAEPELSAAEVKARLVSSAVPDPGSDVYGQGGGRVDVAAALAAPVQVSRSSLALGLLPGSGEVTDPVRSELTYTNLTGEPLNAAIDVEVRSRDGQRPESLTVSPGEFRLAAGDEQRVTVTLGGSAGAVGLFGGYLTATADEVVTRTPVGLQLGRPALASW